MTWRIEQGDCLELMAGLAAQSVDAILTDLPYGTTACKWDVMIPFAPMWAAVRRVLKPRGAFVTTASQPFTSALVMSNPAWFRHCWTWEKDKAANFVTCNVRPLAVAEDIIVFGNGSVNYYPQMHQLAKPDRRSFVGNQIKTQRHPTAPIASPIPDEATYTHHYPRSVLRISNSLRDKQHPTQKPVALYAYLIRTYTNEGDTVLDFCCGAGTTLVAAINTGRNSIGFDSDSTYCDVARKRCEQAEMQLRLPLL